MKPQKLLKLLEGVKGWREQAFALALAERAAPNAYLFLDSVELGDVARDLSVVIERGWQMVLRKPDEDAVVEALDQLDDVRLSVDGQEGYGVAPTLDVLDISVLALWGMLNDDKRRCSEASQRSLDTVTQFIEFSEGDGLSESALIKLFDSHPLIEREFSFQQELYDMLRSAPHLSADLIESLRILAKDEGVSNIGICLED